MVDVNFRSTMVNMSDRIQGQNQEGVPYDIYILQVRVQNDMIDFTINNDETAQAYIPFLKSLKFGEVFTLTVSMNKNRKTKRWYVNVKGASKA